ncbi:ABC transporter ATP-binding protein [Pendulispora albinea]|uniref:ABC transporter ATP-binding protein n=1 Tax=Pendulispora albinea TaxID=2741071 RepID=A0ABZ2MB40_9BACT
MAIIQLEGVTKNYGTGVGQVRALRGVDLVIDKGEFAAICGPSGSGKSTLLNLVSGLDRATSGRVLVDDVETTKLSDAALSHLRLQKIGFVFQAYNLIPVLDALENVEYVMMLQGRDLKERRARARHVLSLVGLSGMEARFPAELSGGQQQRVAIARAIAAEPRLVLADEPTANLDAKTAASLIDLMAELNETKGITFVFSTHDPAVMRRARRCIAMTDGLVDEAGSRSGDFVAAAN